VIPMRNAGGGGLQPANGVTAPTTPLPIPPTSANSASSSDLTGSILSTSNDGSGEALQRAMVRHTVKMQGWIQRLAFVDGEPTWKNSFTVLEGGYLRYFLDVRIKKKSHGIYSLIIFFQIQENQVLVDNSATAFPVHMCHAEVGKTKKHRLFFILMCLNYNPGIAGWYPLPRDRVPAGVV